MNSDNCIIGIDLGTCYSCVAVYINGGIDIITNDIGERITPSWVAFDRSTGERYIGASAKTYFATDPTNTIYDAKRLIGRKMSDTTVQKDLKHFSFTVRSNNTDDKPTICIKIGEETKDFYPEQISAIILGKMKEVAEARVGFPIKKAVVTVPAYFNNSQRQSTMDAGVIAGLEIVRIINEPTAAAMAYGLDKLDNNEERIVLVFDLGGGTFDVSLLNLNDGLFEVIATSGNTHLGGEDFDNKLVQECLKEFVKKNQHIDVKALVTSKRTLSRLKSACERAKKNLSLNTITTIEVDSLYDGIDFRQQISRSRFESLCEEEFKKCFEPVTQVLTDARMTKDQVTDIVLVGGSTRIPKIRDMLRDYFNGKEPHQNINPDEAVAYGAAIQGAILGKIRDARLDSIVLMDITPLSLGIETSGGIMSKLINRNASIPCNKEQTFSTYSDNQIGVTIRIYEGEREFTKHNNLLGTFELMGIPPMPRGVPKIKVMFELDVNGILHVTATEESSNRTQKITIKKDKNNITSAQLQSMLEDAKKFEESDRKLREQYEAKNNLESYIYNIRNISNSEDMKLKLGDSNCQTIAEIVSSNLSWLEDNPNLPSAEYIGKHKLLETIVTPIFMIAYNS